MSSYWFIPMVVESILLLILIAYDNGLWATITLVSTLLVVHITGLYNIIAFVKDNGVSVLVGTGAYLFIGFAWAIAKWIMYVFKKKDTYRELKKHFVSVNGITTDVIPSQFKEKWQHELRYNDLPPSIGKHKSDMTRWTFYWPFSMINSLVRDFARKMFNIVFEAVKNSLQKIADKIFADVSQDYK
jgi:hypothetical protein